MKILSPAKINLMLRILGQRADGYHFLQTYFQLLDWGDSMEFRLNNSQQVSIHGDFGALPKENNLIFKAAQLLLSYRQTNHGINILIDKKIPHGSGLGGGSSNAGTTLRILNKMWQCNLPQKKLLQLALKLGADVPVFVLNQSAMARGVGEELTPYTINNHYFVLIFPKTSISTIDVFAEEMLIRDQAPIALYKIKNKVNWSNACLPVVLKKFPEVEDLFTKASKLAPIYMSGTGSTLFSCFQNNAEAEHFIDQCPSHWNVELCQSKINQ